MCMKLLQLRPNPPVLSAVNPQDPIIAAQASSVDDSAAAAIESGAAAVRGQAPAARVLLRGDHARRAAGLVPHHRAQDRPARGRRAASPPAQRGQHQR